MNTTSKQGAGQPFFLAVEPGQRFCLFHPPLGDRCRGAILYVPPFGEEMNKSRRMAALQARALAQAGYGVLQIDLYGSGDSSGEFAQARWDLWKNDLAAAVAWLAERLGQPATLWGLRLGATLALDFVRDPRPQVDQLILWQPVLNGNVFMTQFLRLLTARAMVAEGAAGSAPSTSSLRKLLSEGSILEVAGYELAPELAAAIDSVDLAQLAPTRCPVHWFETAAATDRPLAPALERLLAGWRAQGTDVTLHRLACTQFWATQEIEEAPELLAATLAVICGTTDELSRTRA